MRPATRANTAFVALAATGILLAGCADDPESGDGHDHSHDGHGHDHGQDQGADGAGGGTPAYEIPDADLVSAEFQPLDTAPEGHEDATGATWLARHDDGTTVTIDVTGLEPGTEYMSHLHEQPCAQDQGGPHFKFDPQGSDEPPNEVHLMFTADSDGTAATTVHNDNPGSDSAQSIVLHLTDEDGTKFACADL